MLYALIKNRACKHGLACMNTIDQVSILHPRSPSVSFLVLYHRTKKYHRGERSRAWRQDQICEDPGPAHMRLGCFGTPLSEAQANDSPAHARHQHARLPVRIAAML